jgi:hypothetical protein
MGGSVGKSESDSQNQGNFSQGVWEGQAGPLGALYSQAGNLFGGGNQSMQQQIPGAVGNLQGIFDQSMQPWQNQMQGGAYQGMDLQGQYNRDRQGGGNEQFINESIMGGAGNNYVDAMKGQLQQDSTQRLGQSLATLDNRAGAYGQSGSSRHGLAQSKLFDDSNRDLSRQQTNIGFDTFDKDLDRKLGIAQRADQFDMDRLNLSGQMLGNQNQAMQGGLNYGGQMQNLGMGQFAPYMAPWQAMGQYANTVGAPTVLGSGQSSGDSSSKGFGLSGSMGPQ